jgi:hypothetical protein
MSEETIPLTFEAIDNLSKAIAKMTEMLEKMGFSQAETTKATDKATDATEKQGEAADSTSSFMERLNAGLEVAKKAYELAGVAIEVVRAGITRSNEAWDEQSKKLGKSASSLGSVAEANVKLEKAQTKVFASVGKIIDRSSVFQAVSLALTDVLVDINKWLGENSQAISEWGNKIAVDGSQKIQELGKYITENSETIARWAIGLSSVKDLFMALVNAGDVLVQFLKISLYGALTAVSTVVLGLTELLIYLIDYTGRQVPQALEDMRLGLEETSKIGVDGLKSSFNGLVDATDNAWESGANFFGKLSLAAGGTKEQLKGTISLLDVVGETVTKTGLKIEENLNRGVKGKGKGRKDLIDAETAAEEKRQRVLLDYEKRIIEAQRANNDELVIQLQKEKAIVEARQSLRDIKTSGLREITMEVAELKAQVEYETAILELAKNKRDEQVALHDIEMQARKEALDFDLQQDDKAKERYDLAIANITAREEREIASIEYVAQAISDAFANAPSYIDNISESTERMLAGFQKASLGVGKLAKAFKGYNAQGATAEDQQEAINVAIGAGAGVLSSVTSSFIKNKQKQAAIEALINTAASAASFADGNIPAGIAYASAAVSYGAAAAFGGGGGGGAGAGSGATASQAPIDLNAERRANAEAIAEALGVEGRAGGGTVINVDFGNAIIASESPEAAQILANMVAPQLARLIGR